jgi:photosystem II stability/assembly factor-like uncharacterized protein
LIALAVIVIVVGSVVYLSSTLTSTSKTASPAANPLLVTSDAVRFNFVSPWVGWALDFSESQSQAVAGRFWILRTLDGGKHWQTQLTGQNGYNAFIAEPIQVFDKDHGFIFVGGSPDQLYRTADGGAQRDLVSLPPNRRVERLAFSDPSNGWLLAAANSTLSQRSLFSTHDAGNSWQRLGDPPTDAAGLSFRRPSEAWMGSLGPSPPHVYVSSDSSQSWQRLDLPAPGPSWDPTTDYQVSGNLLPTAGVVVAAFLASTQSGAPPGPFYFTSVDGGITWRHVQLPLDSVAYQDQVHWWAINGRVLLKSSDAGRTWIQVADNLPDGLTVPYILDSKHAWALQAVVGGYGLALTNDGGLHWTRANVPKPA